MQTFYKDDLIEWVCIITTVHYYSSSSLISIAHPIFLLILLITQSSKNLKLNTLISSHSYLVFFVFPLCSILPLIIVSASCEGMVLTSFSLSSRIYCLELYCSLGSLDFRFSSVFLSFESCRSFMWLRHVLQKRRL